jgi:phage tail tape-measure protein
VAAAAIVSLFAGCASWKDMSRTEKGTAIGATTGAVAGAAVGGPVGAAVGAGVGGVVGHEAEAPGARSGTSTATAASDSSVRAAQESLAAKGYYTGRVDGMWGPDTERAVRDYQRAQGISETGRLDGATMTRLGVSR